MGARVGQVDENEWTMIRKDGSRFPVTLSATSFFDKAGVITGFLGVIADITERKQAEEKLAARISFILSQTFLPLRRDSHPNLCRQCA